MDFRIDQHPKGAVFHLTRSSKLNSLTEAIWAALAHCVDELEARGATFLIITAEGERAFCAGTDLNESRSLSAEQRDAKNDRVRAFLFRLSQSSLITVAALNGLAYGGGLELAMACTVRIAAPGVLVSLPEVKLGVLPAYGGTQFLVALVGPARAADLMLSGRAMAVQEAFAIGLVSIIATSDESLVAQALNYAEAIANFSPLAVAGIRRCISAAGSKVSEDGLSVEAREARLVARSEDAREGIAAFLDKRPAVFKGC